MLEEKMITALVKIEEKKAEPIAYSHARYVKYRDNRPRKNKKCGLMTCYVKLKRFADGRRQSKYCCPEHAILAHKYQQSIWRVDHPEKMKAGYYAWLARPGSRELTREYNRSSRKRKKLRDKLIIDDSEIETTYKKYHKP
jgi:hypothetical protein